MKTFLIDNELHGRFIEAISKAHGGRAYGNISREHRAAIEDRIKKLEETK